MVKPLTSEEQMGTTRFKYDHSLLVQADFTTYDGVWCCPSIIDGKENTDNEVTQALPNLGFRGDSNCKLLSHTLKRFGAKDTGKMDLYSLVG